MYHFSKKTLFNYGKYDYYNIRSRSLVAMKPSNPTKLRSLGMTLLELTIVILVLMGMISVLFIGAKSYLKAADRTQCILNIRNVQVAVRSYQNMFLLDTGDDIQTDDLINEQSGFISALPSCPAQGDYTLVVEIPALGELALDCSIDADLPHQPNEHNTW